MLIRYLRLFGHVSRTDIVPLNVDVVILKEGTYTVNSRSCGHCGDHDLVSVLARVRNNGMREKKNLENVLTGRGLLTC